MEVQTSGHLHPAPTAAEPTLRVGPDRRGGVLDGSGDARAGWGRSDWVASALICGIPAVLLAIAGAAGYPLLTGDDAIQNLPLGVLTGEVLRHGHLPLFDGFVWSGTPLLGGANAHALLPTTLLFAVLPPLAAWVLGEVLIVSVAAVGTQLFLRRTGCSALPAAIGAATFALGGFVSSQLVHIDFVAAAAGLPWMLVALHGIATRGPSTATAARHALLLAVAICWSALSASPDIVIDGAVLGICYLAHLLLQPAAVGGRMRRRVGVCAWAALGLIAGVAVAALQWWPAADFVGVSQRANPGYHFLTVGSILPAQLLLLFVPRLLGGGPIGLLHYAGTYQLSELDAAPGIVALAAVAILAWRWRRPEAQRWRVFLLVGVLGAVLSLGGHTPLEHLLAMLPVTGQERLPSRALVLVALASAVSVAYLLDELARSRAVRGESTRARWSRGDAVAGLVPVAVVFGVTVATAITGRPAAGALGTVAGSRWSLAAVAPALAVSALLAAIAGGVLVGLRRLGPRRSAGVLAALAILGLILFDFDQSSLAPIPSSILAARSPEIAKLRSLAAGRRVLVADPRLVAGFAADKAGGPDLGVIAGISEAGGYGSIVWAPYAGATGTHAQDAVDRSAALDGTLSSLGVRLLLALPGDLARNGALHGIDRVGLWRTAGRVGPFVALVNSQVAPEFKVEGASGSSKVLSSSVWTGAALVTVRTAHPGLLVRATAAIPGWQATIAHGHLTYRAAVRRHGPGGLVQSVRVPAGKSLVSFSYVPPGWEQAQWSASAGALLCLGLAVAASWPRRRLQSRISAAGAGCPPRA